MYLILIAWFYVTLMMAIAEASSPAGSVLGGLITFVLYGLLPMAIVGYILATPERKRRLKARREAEQQAWNAAQAQPPSTATDASGTAADHAATPAIAGPETASTAPAGAATATETAPSTAPRP